MTIEKIDPPQHPPAPYDPMDPDPANPQPLPLPPDSDPPAPVREPDMPPDVMPQPHEPTRIFTFGLRFLVLDLCSWYSVPWHLVLGFSVLVFCAMPICAFFQLISVYG